MATARASISTRAEELGRLGTVFQAALDANETIIDPLITIAFPMMTAANHAAVADHLLSNNYKLVGIAYYFLVCPVVLQVPYDPGLFDLILDYSLMSLTDIHALSCVCHNCPLRICHCPERPKDSRPKVPWGGKNTCPNCSKLHTHDNVRRTNCPLNRKQVGKFELYGVPIDLDNEAAEKPFPIKSISTAQTKTNVWFSDVLRATHDHSLVDYGQLLMRSGLMRGLFNDQAAAYVMHAMVVSQHYPATQAWDVTLRMIWDLKGCKTLSTVIKGLGWNSRIQCAVLTEAQCLAGRSVGDIDLVEKARERTRPPRSMPSFGHDQLRGAIREILTDELDLDKVVFENPDYFWQSRWSWSVNGAHSRVLQRHEPRWTVPFPGQLHRRVAMEHWTDNPLKCWTGKTYVSASKKLEHGKTRLLLAHDTATYTVLSHILAPVEKAWRNERILLDPGSSGMTGIAKKVLAFSGAYWLMLDYDDFNAQHTMDVQKILFEELISITGYDRRRGDQIIRSFDRMLMTAEGQDLGYALYGLMSGSRATSFTNSVLNAAYVKCACPHIWNRFESLHTGDDIVARVSNLTDAFEIIDSLNAYGIRINPMKQSLGAYTAEFLRMAITSDYSIGYVCRAIASVISGNWSNEAKLSPAGVVRNLIVSARSLINRSGVQWIFEMLVPACRRATGFNSKTLRRLLSGDVALGDGPVYDNNGQWSGIEITERTKLPRSFKDKVVSHATTDYLSHCLRPMEIYALTVAGVSIKEAMLEASYAKTLASNDDTVTQLVTRFVHHGPRPAMGMIRNAELVHPRRLKGAFEASPVLNLLKNRLHSSQVKQMLTLAGYDWNLTNWRAVAWGADPVGVVVRGQIPYNDAAAFGKTHPGMIVHVNYPVCM